MTFATRPVHGAAARTLVRAATRLIRDPQLRQRYREQWLADLDGAAELDMAPLRVACGAAAAAVRLATTVPRPAGTPVGVERATGYVDALRRAFEIMQLWAAAPYAAALACYGYARVRLGEVSAQRVMYAGLDPKDLLLDAVPFFGVAPLVAYAGTPLWLAAGGWKVAVLLAPFGLVLALGGRGAARWLPLLGTSAAPLAAVIGHSAFGRLLTIWLLD